MLLSTWLLFLLLKERVEVIETFGCIYFSLLVFIYCTFFNSWKNENCKKNPLPQLYLLSSRMAPQLVGRLNFSFISSTYLCFLPLNWRSHSKSQGLWQESYTALLLPFLYNWLTKDPYKFSPGLLQYFLMIFSSHSPTKTLDDMFIFTSYVIVHITE